MAPTQTQTHTTSYWIQPLDTLFFRDGKDFNKSEDNWGTGTFPPSPSPFYGALRTWYFSQFPEELGKANQKDDPTQNLEILFFSFARRTEGFHSPLFPIPYDLVTKKDEKNGSLVKLELKSNSNTNSSSFSYLLFAPEDGVFQRPSGFLTKKGFQEYLRGAEKISSEEWIRLDSTFLREAKIGIARSQATHAAQEHMIYRVGMARIKENFGFLLQTRGLDLPSQGLIRLGGEAKGAKVAKIEDKEDLLSSFNSLEKNQENQIVKMVLLTSAVFQEGWHPQWMQKHDDKWLARIDNLEMELLTASIGRPEKIGGYDMKNNIPKIMYQAVPAGSTYYFRFLKGDPANLAKLQGKSLSEKRSKEGFGLAFWGLDKIQE